jgi:hypothetical protein
VNEDEDEVFVEKFCSQCGKMSWDSQTGTYNECHDILENGEPTNSMEPCDTVGTRVMTNSEQTTYYYADGRVEKFDNGGDRID